jgi:hypothetical protein
MLVLEIPLLLVCTTNLQVLHPVRVFGRLARCRIIGIVMVD